MEYVTVVINNTEYPAFTKNQLETIPLFQGMQGDKITIDSPFDVEFRHIAALHKIVKKAPLTPTVDLKSHQDVIIVVRLAKYVGLNIEAIVEGFEGWSKHRKWVDLWGAEYLYLLYNEAEELADFKKFFRTHKHVFECIARAVKLPEMKANPELYIEMLLFFKNYNFAICFDSNNEKVQARIDMLNKGRQNIWESFLVNPHESFMHEYFMFTPTNYQVWECANISAVNIPQVGENMMIEKAIAFDRVKNFTYEMMEKPLNAEIKTPFPYDKIVFAGGSISKLLGSKYSHKNARQSDWDMFVIGKTYDERSKNFEQVVNWFKTYDPKVNISHTFYALRGSVTTIYVKNIPRKFQIISINCTNPYEVIARFDMSHIQWCLWNGSFYGTPEACKAMREKVTRFSNLQRVRVPRLVKALHCGYNIYKDASILDIVDITPLITLDEEGKWSLQLQKMIRDLYGFYYPKDDADMEPEELRQHILCMIEKDANATLVTDDPNFVMNNVTISGTFENDYESILYSTFNPATIVNRMQGRRVTKVLLRNKHHAIRLTSGILKVTNIIVSDVGLDILCRPDDEKFREFCAQMEGPVFRMFRNGGVTRRILSDAGEIKFSIPRYRLDSQAVQGKSCMRSQRGAALNIEEDLKPGDDIQVLFMLTILMTQEERAVELSPVKFVKYCKYDPEEAAKIVQIEENLENEIETLSKQIEFDGEIKYEDE